MERQRMDKELLTLWAIHGENNTLKGSWAAIWADRKNNDGFCGDEQHKGGSCYLLAKDEQTGWTSLQSLCTLSCSCGLISLLPPWPHSCMSSELTYSGYLSYRFHQTETFLHLRILWFTSIALRKFQYLFCFFSWGKTQAQTLASLFSVECLTGLRKDVIPQLHAVGYMIKSQSHYASWMQVSES